ncbi:MAG: cysteine desulfurase family protein [Myxococcota bacterium]
MNAAYLDHNASTPVAPEVLDAMLPWLSGEPGNPSSGHAYGRRAKAAIEAARGELAQLIGALPEEIIFTSGGTEASNLAIFGLAAAGPADRRALVSSAIEHPATREPLAELARRGFPWFQAPVDSGGQVQMQPIRQQLGPTTLLLSLIHAHNETGVVQPLAELAPLAKAQGAWVHADAAQSIGKLPVSVDALGVDLLTIAGHKLYAPKGIGALYVRRGTPLAPHTRGASHERGLRPGTENVAGIVGLGRAAALCQEHLQADTARIGALRDRLEALLLQAIPGLVVHGQGSPRLPNTLSVRFPGRSGTQILAAAARHVAASTGSACHDGHETAPAAIVAMGVPEAEAIGTIRLSLGRRTSGHDITSAAAALKSAWSQP